MFFRQIEAVQGLWCKDLWLLSLITLLKVEKDSYRREDIMVWYNVKG